MIGLLEQLQRRALAEPFDHRSSSSRSASASRVPCRNSIGMRPRRDARRARPTACRRDAAESRGTRARARPAAARSPAPATSCGRRTICRRRSAAARGSVAPLPRPPRAPPRGRPPADPAACCLSPCRETDSAASRCRARRARSQPSPSTGAPCRRRRHARTRSTRAPAADRSTMPRLSPQARSRSGAVVRRRLSNQQSQAMLSLDSIFQLRHAQTDPRSDTTNRLGKHIWRFEMAQFRPGNMAQRANPDLWTGTGAAVK